MFDTILIGLLFVVSIIVGALVAKGFKRLIAADDRKIRRRMIERDMRFAVQDAEDQQSIARKLLAEYDN